MTPYHRATHGAPLAIQILGGRVNYQIGPQRQRLLQGRREETVIDGQQGPAALRQRSQSRNIGHFGERIGRRFGEHQPSGGRYRGLPGCQIGELHIARGNAKLAQILVEQADRRAKQRTRGDDLIPRRQQCQGSGKNGGHARAGGDAALTAFQGRQSALEGVYRRIGETRVDVTRLLTTELTGSFGSTLVNKARGGKNRLGMLLLKRAVVPRANGERFERPLLLVMIIVHGSALFSKTSSFHNAQSTGNSPEESCQRIRAQSSRSSS